MKPNILIVGDSHVHALRDALREPGFASDRADITAHRLAGGKVAGDLTYDEALIRAAGLQPHDILVTLIRGNQHNMLGLMQHPQPFDIMMPGDTVSAGKAGSQDATAVIPFRTIEHLFSQTLRSGYGKLILRLAKATPARVVCVETPAPKRDTAHILSGAESYFRANGIDKVGVSPAPLRLRLWTLQHAALRALCAEHAITYLPDPPGTCDADGFLKPEFYARDATHANPAYGRKVLQQIVDLIGDVAPA